MSDMTMESMGLPLIYKVAIATASGFPEPINGHSQSGRTCFLHVFCCDAVKARAAYRRRRLAAAG
jgi:hypothetical protein